MSRKRKRKPASNETPDQVARRLATEKITVGSTMERRAIVQADGPARWAKQLDRDASRENAKVVSS